MDNANHYIEDNSETYCKIIIAGGRDFDNYDLMKKSVIPLIENYYSKLYKGFEIVSGCANGADTLAIRLAEEYGYKVTKMPADWEKNGKIAGFMRNKEMGKYAVEDGSKGVLFAFWDGRSKGTSNMIEISNDLNFDIHITRYNKE